MRMLLALLGDKSNLLYSKGNKRANVLAVRGGTATIFRPARTSATAVAIDTETMGLAVGRDRLCVVQLSRGDGDAHVVRRRRPA